MAPSHPFPTHSLPLCENPPSTMSASLHSLAFCTSVSRRPRLPRAAAAGGISIQNLASSFNGESVNIRLSSGTGTPSRRRSSSRSMIITAVKPSIQFIPGTDERTVPDVKLTKSRDGTNGQAIFKFDEPSVFDSSSEVGDITGFFMIDEEGTLQSVDVSARFVNGKPAGIEAKYVMRTPRDWDRFMRFMERYANANGLAFVKS